MAASDLRLDILGTSFSINADEDSDYLEEILRQYRSAIENTQNISGLTDPLKTAILTGFLLADEIHKLKIEVSKAREIEACAMGLIAKIDRVMEDKSPGNA